MKKTVSVNVQDVLSYIYFIGAIAKKNKGATMSGALSSRGDLIGGIFDRWINTIPESIVFNKIIFSNIKGLEEAKVVSDFYIYDPKESGIAPDVLGINIKNNIIPFVTYNEDNWYPVSGMPQIEVKTFKKNQKMISLRDQNYEDDKYLVLVESDFKIDYLLPFFDKSFFSNDIFKELYMDNQKFIISDTNNKIGMVKEIIDITDEIGSLSLLGITKMESLKSMATFCGKKISIQRIDSLEKVYTVRGSKEDEKKGLSYYCDKTKYDNFYVFNSNFSTDKNILNLTIFVKDIDEINIIKKNKTNFYIEAMKDTMLNSYKLEKGNKYKLNLAKLDRSSNNGEEYFYYKDLLSYLPSYDAKLIDELKKIAHDN